jgi:hypothetical protein
VGAPVLAHEIIGLAIAGKVHGVALQLEIVPEMETAGGMAESFAADNKEYLHLPCRMDLS